MDSSSTRRYCIISHNRIFFILSCLTKNSCIVSSSEDVLCKFHPYPHTNTKTHTDARTKHTPGMMSSGKVTPTIFDPLHCGRCHSVLRWVPNLTTCLIGLHNIPNRTRLTAKLVVCHFHAIDWHLILRGPTHYPASVSMPPSSPSPSLSNKNTHTNFDEGKLLVSHSHIIICFNFSIYQWKLDNMKNMVNRLENFTFDMIFLQFFYTAQKKTLNQESKITSYTNL